jgi:quercetin dioxygenase-like cupin family protein
VLGGVDAGGVQYPIAVATPDRPRRTSRVAVGTPSRTLAWPARKTGASSDEVKVNENRNRLGRTTPHWLVLLAAIPLIVSIAAPLPLTSAQETAPTPAGADEAPIRENLFQAILEELPAAPAFIRIVRITLQPGATVPLHTHPGPEFGRVENGVMTVRVEGEVVIAQATVAGTPQAPRVPPIGQEFDLVAGDQIVYPSGVPFSFSNLTLDPVSVITAVILPAGSGSPPGSEWIDGTPGPEAMAGVTSQILGDAVAPGWPEPPFAIVLDRLVLAPGEAIPARGGPVILAIELGRFGFALVDGQFQLSRGNSGPLAVATPGVPYILSPGDAVFFPGGMNEVPRPEADGVLVLVRFSIVNAEGLIPGPAPAGQPTAAPAATEAAAAPATPTPAQPAAAAPTETPAPAGAPAGTAVINEAGVRLRDSPSTTGAVVAELGAGREVIITGEAVEGDGIRWFPIQAADDPAVTGFVAENFLDLAP